MSHAPTIRTLRERLLVQSILGSPDEVELEALRQDIGRFVREIRQSLNRVIDFASRGCVGEAAALAEDFPDLAEQASALARLPSSDPSIARAWALCTDASGPLSWVVDAMPRQPEIDIVMVQTARAADLRPLLDAYRSACLRQESITIRLRLLKKLRAEDVDNRMWLDQMRSLETEWLKWATERSRDRAASRSDLEEILSILNGREWLASVPRGLPTEVLARLKPMRAETADQRFADIAERIHLAAARLDWAEIARLEADWAGVYHDTGRMPDPEVEAPVRVVFDALTERQAEQSRAAEFAALCDALDRELDAHPPGVRSPNEPAIERTLQAVRDFGGHAPEGLVERAVAHLDAIREARSRRSRMMLLAGVGAAAIAAIVLAVAIRIQTLRAAEASSRETLAGHIEAGRWKDAEILAERIRREIDDPRPETAAVLVRHDEGLSAWRDRQARAVEALAAAEARLAADDPVDRTTHSGIVGSLAAVRPEFGADLHRDRLEAVDGRLAAILAGLDEADRARVGSALAGCEEAISRWARPDRWTARQRIDPERWSDYGNLLAGEDRKLADVLAVIEGFAEGESDLGRKREELADLIREAHDRRASLDEALQAIAPAAIGKPVISEADFVARLQEARTRFGDVLMQRGELSAFEAASSLAPAWIALESWRGEPWLQLDAALGGDFMRPHPTPAVAAAKAVIDTYLGKHPETPLRKPIESLVARLGDVVVAKVWGPKELETALQLEALAGLERVEIFRSDGRFFYRRSLGRDDNPRHHAIRSREDLLKEPARLGAAMLPPGDVPGVSMPDPVSRTWAEFLDRTRVISEDEVQSTLLELVRALRQVQGSDPLLQLHAIARAVDLLREGGLVPVRLQPGLNAWRRDLAGRWRDGADIDWARVTLDPPAELQAPRSRAREAILAFPDIDASLAEDGPAKRSTSGELGRYVPVGILLMADGTGVRRFTGSERSPDVALVRSMPGRDGMFELVEASIVDGTIDVNGLGIPDGPVLVFRRNDR